MAEVLLLSFQFRLYTLFAHDLKFINELMQIKLQLPDEYLVGVSGHYGPVINSGTPVITSITFTSNKRTFGPYGVESGTPFVFSSDGAEKIVGFKGRSGWFLDEIGLYLAPAKRPSGLYYRVQQTLKNLVHQLLSRNKKTSILALTTPVIPI